MMHIYRAARTVCACLRLDCQESETREAKRERAAPTRMRSPTNAAHVRRALTLRNIALVSSQSSKHLLPPRPRETMPLRCCTWSPIARLQVLAHAAPRQTPARF